MEVVTGKIGPGWHDAERLDQEDVRGARRRKPGIVIPIFYGELG